MSVKICKNPLRYFECTAQLRDSKNCTYDESFRWCASFLSPQLHQTLQFIPRAESSFEWTTIIKWPYRRKIQIIQPTRCNSFPSLLLDFYVWLNMLRMSLRASPHPSSGAHNCTRSLWFYRWKAAAGALLVVVWQVACQTGALLVVVWQVACQTGALLVVVWQVACQTGALLVVVWQVACQTGALLVVVWQVACQTTTNNAPAASLQR